MFYPSERSQKQQFKTIVTDLCSSFSDVPYDCHLGSAVVLNGEIHILGGGDANADKVRHYKWDGDKWTSVSTLPYSFSGGSAVVLNDEIHIIGGSASGTNTNHYKWDGSTWTSVSTLPYSWSNPYSTAVVYNNEIHIMNGYNSAYHYKWDGTTWTQLSGTPFVGSALAVVYNNELHLMGGSTYHYKWDSSTWTSVGTLPTGMSGNHTAYVTVMGNSIYYYVRSGSYCFNGSSWSANKYLINSSGTWTKATYTPHDVFSCCCATLGGVHLIGGIDSNNNRNKYHDFENINLYIPMPT